MSRSWTFPLVLPIVASVGWAALPVSDYDLYPLGAKANAVGGACVAFIDDMSALHWNPAGLAAIRVPTAVYLFDSQFLLSDPRETLASEFRFAYQAPPLVGVGFPAETGDAFWAFSVSTPVQRKFGYGAGGMYLIQGGVSYGRMFGNRWAVGVTAGFLTSNIEWGWGVSGRAGLQWTVDERWRLGLALRAPVVFSWDGRRRLLVPWSAQVGAAVRLAGDSVLSMDWEYVDWLSARWIEAGVERDVPMAGGLFRSWIPHLGWSMTESSYGARVRFGFTARSELDGGRLEPRYLLSLGVGARALRYLRLEASLVDSLLLSLLIPSQRPVETLQITCEYRFE